MAGLTFFSSAVISLLMASQSARAMTIAVTTTEDPLTLECRMGRIRPDEQSNRFQQVTQDADGNDVWIVLNCQDASLEWDQDACQCVQPLQVRTSRCDYQEVAGSTNQYQQITSPFTTFTCVPSDSLFWNQTGCRCDWIPGGPMTVILPPIAPCEDKFFSTFDTSADVTQLSMTPWKRVPLSTVAGANGKAYFSNGNDMALIYSMSYTDLGKGMAVDFRFRSFNDQGTNNQFVALVTNGCSEQESIAIGYRSIDATYEVTLKSMSTVDGTTQMNNYMCQDNTVADGFQWNTVSLSYAEGVVTLTVNGVVCLGEVIADSKPAQPKCPLVIGADQTKQRPFLFGYVDELRVRRYCEGPVVV